MLFVSPVTFATAALVLDFCSVCTVFSIGTLLLCPGLEVTTAHLLVLGHRCQIGRDGLTWYGEHLVVPDEGRIAHLLL